MGIEITIHTGDPGDRNKIHIDWHDENNARQRTEIEIDVQKIDHPRCLSIRLNGATIATVQPIDH